MTGFILVCVSVCVCVSVYMCECVDWIMDHGDNHRKRIKRGDGSVNASCMDCIVVCCLQLSHRDGKKVFVELGWMIRQVT